jgi:hypothetical protein
MNTVLGNLLFAHYPESISVACNKKILTNTLRFFEIILAFYYHIRNYHKLSASEQQKFIISQ